MATLKRLDIVLGARSTKLFKDLRTAQYKIKRVGMDLKNIGSTITKGFTVPIAAAGAASVKFASDFGSSMTKIAALVGVPRKEIEAMEPAIFNLSTELGKMPTELMGAMYYITSASFRGADAMNILTESTKASTAGLGDVSGIARTASAAIRNYGIENMSAAKAVNTMAAGVKKGNFEAAELAPVLGNILPIAQSLGVGLDEVTASMAVMTQKGADITVAATSIRQVLASILSPAEGAKVALAGLGLSAEGLRNSLRDDGLLATMQILKESFGENKYAIEAVFGNIKALTGALVLVGDDAEQTAEIFHEVANSAGAVDAALKEVTSRALFPMKQTLADVAVLGIKLGRLVIPYLAIALRPLLKAVRAVSTAFDSLPERIKNSIVPIGALVAAIGPAIIVIGAFVAAFGAIGATTLEVAGVVVALGALVLGWDKIKEGAMAAWDVIKPIAAEIGTFVSAQFERAKASAARIWPDIQKIVANSIKFANILWEKHGAKIKFVMRTAWSAVREVVSTAIGVVLGVMETLSAFFAGDFSKSLEASGSTFMVVFGAYKRISSVTTKLIIAGFHRLKSEVAQVIMSMSFNFLRIGKVFAALPFLSPAMRAAAEAGLTVMRRGISAVAMTVIESERDWKKWTTAAEEAMTAPFYTGVEKVGEVVTATASIAVGMQETGDKVIKVFDDAGNEVEGSLSGGFGRAADNIKFGVQQLNDWLKKNPIRPVVEGADYGVGDGGFLNDAILGRTTPTP